MERVAIDSLAWRDCFDVALAAVFGAVALTLFALLGLLRVFVVGLRGRV